MFRAKKTFGLSGEKERFRFQQELYVKKVQRRREWKRGGGVGGVEQRNTTPVVGKWKEETKNQVTWKT
jgi:hypothetical protein